MLGTLKLVVLATGQVIPIAYRYAITPLDLFVPSVLVTHLEGFLEEVHMLATFLLLPPINTNFFVIRWHLIMARCLYVELPSLPSQNKQCPRITHSALVLNTR